MRLLRRRIGRRRNSRRGRESPRLPAPAGAHSDLNTWTSFKVVCMGYVPLNAPVTSPNWSPAQFAQGKRVPKTPGASGCAFNVLLLELSKGAHRLGALDANAAMKVAPLQA